MGEVDVVIRSGLHGVEMSRMVTVTSLVQTDETKHRSSPSHWNLRGRLEIL
jgi:hypothetical protein